MEFTALLLLLILMCWLQQSGGTCTLELATQEGIEDTKFQMLLDCPSCQSIEATLETSQSCNLHEDLEFNNECIDTDRQCREVYFLQNASSSPSNDKMDAADPDTMIFEGSDGECSTVMLAMGAVLGILAVLLGVVLTGWVWTCWKLKKVAKKNSTQVSYRINSYEDSEINNAPPTDETTPPPLPVYAIPTKKNAFEPSYEKLTLAQSLPALDLSGLGYDVPVKRQPKLKPPIMGGFVDENAMKGTDEYETLKHTTKPAN